MSTPMSAEDRKLAELLGQESAVLLTSMPGADAFREAVKQLTEETNKGHVEQAKVIIKEAIALKRQVDAEENAHKQKVAKIRKSLGKVIQKMARISTGKPADEPKDDDKGGGGNDEGDSQGGDT